MSRSRRTIQGREILQFDGSSALIGWLLFAVKVEGNSGRSTNRAGLGRTAKWEGAAPKGKEEQRWRNGAERTDASLRRHNSVAAPHYFIYILKGCLVREVWRSGIMVVLSAISSNFKCGSFVMYFYAAIAAQLISNTATLASFWTYVLGALSEKMLDLKDVFDFLVV